MDDYTYAVPSDYQPPSIEKMNQLFDEMHENMMSYFRNVEMVPGSVTKAAIDAQWQIFMGQCGSWGLHDPPPKEPA